DPFGALQSLYVGPEVRLPKDIYSQVRLTPWSSQPAARGVASMAVYGTTQELELEVQSLKPRSTYQLAIDGVLVQGVSGISDSMGSLLLTLSNRPAAGDFVLQGQFGPVTSIQHADIHVALVIMK